MRCFAGFSDFFFIFTDFAIYRFVVARDCRLLNILPLDVPSIKLDFVNDDDDDDDDEDDSLLQKANNKMKCFV